MSGWQEVRLGDICEFAYGKSLPAKSRTGQGYPVYGSNGVVGFHDQSLTSGETIVVGRKGSFGEVQYSESPCWPIDTTYYITEDQTDSCLPWLAKILPQLRLTELNRAAAIPGLNREDAYRQRLFLPPLEEQKRIAKILDAADALRAKRRESLAQLDVLLQSSFLDLFGDPTEAGTKGTHQVARLGDLAERVTDGTHQSPTWSAEGIPFLFVSNIRNLEIDFTTKKFISENEYERLTKGCPVEPGDVLYTTVGSYGHAAVVPEGPLFAFQRHIAHIKPKKELVNSDFLAVMLESGGVKKQADRLARGVAQKTLNLKELKSFQVFMPPKQEQDRFAEVLAAIIRQKQQCKSTLRELDVLFGSLQAKAFSGEL